jgi:hypothetical protein
MSLISNSPICYIFHSKLVNIYNGGFNISAF